MILSGVTYDTTKTIALKVSSTLGHYSLEKAIKYTDCLFFSSVIIKIYLISCSSIHWRFSLSVWTS